jgi:glycosyltransferase involved in cell wall biosynthesis
VKVLQINTTVNSGSTGRIAEEIGKVLIAGGNNSLIGFGRGRQQSASDSIRIGGKFDMWMHGIQTLLFDRHGFGSKSATRIFLRKVENWAPDIIHLHNIHGYYLHIGLLGKFLSEYNKPIVWTFHDSWPYTGHCTYFDNIQCERWKTGCYECPKKAQYPTSLLFDRSKQNYIDKKSLFGALENLNLVTPSNWLSRLVEQSFLKNHNLRVIHNGVDLDTFFIRPCSKDFLIGKGLSQKIVILGVASIWDKRKGLQDFISLSNLLDSRYIIVLIGLSKKQLKGLPPNIMGISRTENVHELAKWYSAASVFANPTMQDNFPTTNIEALACGTPVVTYNTGGSPEAIDTATGTVVEKGNLNQMLSALEFWCSKDRKEVAKVCRKRAEENFNKADRYKDYLDLYQELYDKC